jgi:hypothetical protein
LAELDFDFAGYFLVLGRLVIHELLAIAIGQKLIIDRSAAGNCQ